jgi:hypothetical protein
LLEILIVEGEVSRAFQGMGAGDDVVYVDDDESFANDDARNFQSG